MKLVKPIKDRSEVRKFSEALYEVSPREFALFVMGITWGLRISDMLALRIGDVVAGQGKRVQLVKELYIRERKTGKLSCLCVMTDDIRRALWTYLTTRKLDLSSPLFLSRERGPGGQPKAISRWQVYRIFKRAAHAARLPSEYIGTHTMRKTFGYGLLRNGVPIERIMKHLNHSSERETLKYLGIEEDQLCEDKRALKWNVGNIGPKTQSPRQNRNGFYRKSYAEIPSSESYPQNTDSTYFLPLKIED